MSAEVTDDPKTWPHDLDDGGKARDTPDGGKEYLAKNGTRSFTNRAGETWKEISPDGRVIEMLEDGGIKQIEPDGTLITKLRNGTVSLAALRFGSLR